MTGYKAYHTNRIISNVLKEISNKKEHTKVARKRKLGQIINTYFMMA
jgi:hypothetical protein